MTKGINKANIFEVAWRKCLDINSKEHCIFLSHKKEDKEACLEIGKYLEDAGIDCYLDIFDQEL